MYCRITVDNTVEVKNLFFQKNIGSYGNFTKIVLCIILDLNISGL